MRTVVVVLSDKFGQYLLEVLSPEDEQPVRTLPADGADEPFGEGIGPRGRDWSLDDSDTLGAEHLVEALRELGIPVSDEEFGDPGSLGKIRVRFRACWVTHSPTGLEVMPER